MKYYDDNASTIDHVSYKLLDDSGKVIQDYPDSPCFSSITTYTIPKNTAAVLIYHSRSRVPYSIESIERWIRDLNDMGFPCSFIGANKTNYNFQVNVKDYVWKAHLTSTLMLVRALWESGIAVVPERYFQMMDENPNADKFYVMQTAHKTPRKSNNYYSDGGNTNHMVTFKGNGDNVTKDTLFDRYELSKFKVLQGKPGEYKLIAQSDKWKGGRYPVDGCNDCHMHT